MKTPRELRARLSRIDGNRPGLDPIGDARKVYALIGSMAGILGCGDPGPEDEKKGGDSGENTG